MNKKNQPSFLHRAQTSVLMGSVVAFLCSRPARSEAWYHSFQTLVREFFQVTLVFLGIASPAVQTLVSEPVAPAPVAKVRPAAKTVPAAPMALAPAETPLPNAMVLASVPVLRHYTYIFEGRATSKGQPCDNASVLVRLNTGDRTATKGTVTDTDGSYTIEVPIDAVPNAPVDWAIEAFTPDFKKLELSGRKIVTREEDVIIVKTPVDFLAALPRR